MERWPGFVSASLSINVPASCSAWKRNSSRNSRPRDDSRCDAYFVHRLNRRRISRGARRLYKPGASPTLSSSLSSCPPTSRRSFPGASENRHSFCLPLCASSIPYRYIVLYIRSTASSLACLHCNIASLPVVSASSPRLLKMQSALSSKKIRHTRNRSLSSFQPLQFPADRQFPIYARCNSQLRVKKTPRLRCNVNTSTLPSRPRDLMVRMSC